MARRPHWETPTAEVDLRPGGRYRLAMTDTDKNETHVVVGEYKEIQPPERLVYTWAWESKTDEMSGSEDTLVTVEFAEADGGTEVSLTHVDSRARRSGTSMPTVGRRFSQTSSGTSRRAVGASATVGHV